MTPERIAELKALCAAATPGPWLQEIRDELWHNKAFPVARVLGANLSMVANTQQLATGPNLSLTNAALIAASRTALPEALAEIEQLHADLAQYEKHLRVCGHALRDQMTRAQAAEAEVERLNHVTGDLISEKLFTKRAKAAEAEVERLREALKPFADAAINAAEHGSDEFLEVSILSWWNARTALQPREENKG